MRDARNNLYALTLCLLATSCLAAGPKTKVYEKGVLYGTVVDAQGKPIPGAIVALQRTDGKIAGWVKTNANGQYALPANPKVALNLTTHHKTLLEACVRAVGDVVMAPVKAVGTMVTQPGPTVRSAAASVAAGTPAPLLAQTLEASLPTDATAGQVAQAAGGAATYTALGGTPPPPPPPTNPGKTTILVSAPGFKYAQLQPTACWVDGPVESKTLPVGLQAYLETVRLVPTSAKESSVVQPEALTFGTTTIEPQLAPAGSKLTITTVLSAVPDPSRPIRVFAREAGKDTVVELTPAADKRTYTGTITLDPKASPGDTTISIGALRADPVEVRFDPKKPDPLPEFCKRLDEMSAEKPYVYDPLVMGAANRMDIKVTVLSPNPSAPPMGA